MGKPSAFPFLFMRYHYKKHSKTYFARNAIPIME